MKNLILSAATLLTITFSAAAPVGPAVSEKDKSTFTAIFKSVVNVTWT